MTDKNVGSEIMNRKYYRRILESEKSFVEYYQGFHHFFDVGEGDCLLEMHLFKGLNDIKCDKYNFFTRKYAIGTYIYDMIKGVYHQITDTEKECCNLLTVYTDSDFKFIINVNDVDPFFKWTEYMPKDAEKRTLSPESMFIPKGLYETEKTQGTCPTKPYIAYMNENGLSVISKNDSTTIKKKHRLKSNVTIEYNKLNLKLK